MHLLKNKQTCAVFLVTIYMRVILKKFTSKRLKYCRGRIGEEAEVSLLPHDEESQKDNDRLFRSLFNNFAQKRPLR